MRTMRLSGYLSETGSRPGTVRALRTHSDTVEKIIQAPTQVFRIVCFTSPNHQSGPTASFKRGDFFAVSTDVSVELTIPEAPVGS